jgi:putative transposase
MEEVKKERPKDIGRACRVMGTMVYLSVKDDNQLMERLSTLAVEHPREGFWKCPSG